MIRRTTGNLLEALVNAVNTVGVMGKGIALMFKEAFPENYRAYAKPRRKPVLRRMVALSIALLFPLRVFA